MQSENGKDRQSEISELIADLADCVTEPESIEITVRPKSPAE
jgi:hypothetical protein